MNRLILIDGHAVLFRAFHAYPELTTSKGELVNAVYGFANILLNTIAELKPTHIAVAFDRAKPTFRHAAYTQYKATRPETPADLAGQQERVEEVVRMLNIPMFAVEGYEADDVIGTLVEQAKHEARSTKFETIIVTGDHDALQLVDDTRVKVYMPGRGRIPARMYDAMGVAEKYGSLKPEQIPDYKGLVGDSSDNIPGVRGIGPKMAIKLLREFKSVEKIYKNLDQAKDKFGDRVVQQLIDDQEQARLSKELATIDRKVPIELDLAACQVHEYDKDMVIKLFEELEFRSLTKKLPNDSFEQMVQETLL
jgi:DNA polymerase I